MTQLQRQFVSPLFRLSVIDRPDEMLPGIILAELPYERSVVSCESEFAKMLFAVTLQQTAQKQKPTDKYCADAQIN